MRHINWMIGLFVAVAALTGPFAGAATYTADYLPQNPLNNPQWTRIYNNGSESAAGGVLKVTSTANLQQAYRLSGGPASAWNPTTGGSAVEIRMKVDSQVSTFAGSFLLATGNRGWNINFNTNGLQEILGGGNIVTMDTTAFHVYRFTIDGINGPLNMYVDGNTTPSVTWAGISSTANRIDFGDFIAGTVGGVTEWDYIRWTNAGAYPPVNIAKAPVAIAVPSSQSTDTSVPVENVMDDDANTFWVSD